MSEATFHRWRNQYGGMKADEAEPLLKQAMGIKRVAHGEQHPGFAQILDNLAVLYLAMRRPAEAEPLLKQSMEIWRVAAGEQDQYFVTTVNSLAGLYRAMGRHDEAAELLNRVAS